jgi:hypothetical protein
LQLLEKLLPTTEPQLKALEAAVAALNEGKSLAEISTPPSKTAFKKFLPFLSKEAPKAEFQVPEPPMKAKSIPENVSM